MKKILISLFVLCACMMVSCGNSEVDKINQLVIEATEQTKAATSYEQVAEIAQALQDAMDQIEAESGSKIAVGKSVDESLAKYQAAAEAKLAEFGIELEK